MINQVYEKQPSTVLRSVLNGFERDFDDVSTDPNEAKYKPSADWLTNRMSVIRNILEEREEKGGKRS